MLGPALVGLMGAWWVLLCRRESLGAPRGTQGVPAGLGQGQGENPGWNLLLEFPWSEAASKENLVSVIRGNRGQQKKYQE